MTLSMKNLDFTTGAWKYGKFKRKTVIFSKIFIFEQTPTYPSIYFFVLINMGPTCYYRVVSL